MNFTTTKKWVWWCRRWWLYKVDVFKYYSSSSVTLDNTSTVI